VAEALFQYVSERFSDTPAGAAALQALRAVPAGAMSQGSRVELQVWSTLYGLWLGVAVPGALGASGSEPYGLGLLLGGPGGFLAGRALANSRPLSEGQVRAITFGGTWGTWQGFGWARVLGIGEKEVCPGPNFCYTEDAGSRTVFSSLVVGGLAGIATGTVLSRKPISAGTATTVNFGAFWGTWFGVAGSVLADLEGDSFLATTLLGGNAGLVAAALLHPGWNLSRRPGSPHQHRRGHRRPGGGRAGPPDPTGQREGGHRHPSGHQHRGTGRGGCDDPGRPCGRRLSPCPSPRGHPEGGCILAVRGHLPPLH
jgi:hypothetical protein